MANNTALDKFALRDRLNNVVRQMKQEVVDGIKQAVANEIPVYITVDHKDKISVGWAMWKALGCSPDSSPLIGVKETSPMLRSINITSVGIEIPYELLKVYCGS